MESKLKKLLLAAGASAAVALMSVGCSGDRYHRSTGAYLDDKAVSARIKSELLADPVVKGTQVRVRSYEGKVQLSGFVDNDDQKNRAADLARRSKGVQWVKNDLIVKSQVPVNEAAGANNTSTNTVVK